MITNEKKKKKKPSEKTKEKPNIRLSCPDGDDHEGMHKSSLRFPD